MQEQIAKDLIAAMKSGDKATAECLKMLKSALQMAQIAHGSPLDDAAVERVIRKEMKSRSDARDMYAANGRQELADKEESERVLYEKYVPQQLSADDVDAVVASQAATLDDVVFSRLMPLVMQELKGKADGRLVSERVKAFVEGR